MGKSLQEMLIKASQEYYTSGQSNMTDAEFDAALDQLKAEDPDNPIITQVGHGYSIDADNSGQKVPHKYFAGSLAKCHNWQEYPRQFKQDRYQNVGLSVKMDGLSVVMYYISGHLVQALTRGNGSVGFDITAKVKKIEPTFIDLSDVKFTGAVRGEILMSETKFEEYRKINPDAKNPRNTATGLIKGIYIDENDLCFLNIIVYTVIGSETHLFDRYTDVMKWLEIQFEGHVVKWIMTPLHEMTFDDEMTQFLEDHPVDFPYDGVVISLPKLLHDGDEIKYDAVAYKFAAENAVTEVVDVEWSLTKTKYLVPRIKVQQVHLSGANIQYATGFNAKFILDNQIGAGAIVRIMRSGEVIPYIQDIVKPADVVLPATCPCCGEELVWNGVHLQCPNADCGDAAIQNLLIWVKNIAPTFGLGDKLILDFFRSEFEEPSISAVYERGQITNTATYSVQYSLWIKMYNDLFTNKVTLEAALGALNIPRLGEITCRKLACRPELVLKIYHSAEDNKQLSVTDMIDVSTYIGAANTEAIASNLSKFQNLRYIWNNIKFSSEQKDTSSMRKVAITGKLSVKRSEFESELLAAGYVASDSVTSDTFALITDDPNSSSSKNVKATKLNVPKLSEHEFRSKYLGSQES